MIRWLLPLITLVAISGLACSASSDPSPTATPTVATTAEPSATPMPAETPEATATATAAACSFESATPLVFGSVAQVVAGADSGTAFAIGNGEFLTAAHVVAGAETISIRTATAEAPATVVGLEADTDIAILRSDIDGLTPASFGDLSDLAAGQSVAVAGYPTFVEDDPSVVSGLLSKIVEDPDLGFGTFLQTDAAVNPGNSGGPMFDECGEVIGMVVVKVVDTSIEGISWAVAENTLQSALPRVRRKGTPDANTEPDPYYVEIEPESRYIANTGGQGVSLRDDCLEGARLDGSWPEGAPVIRSHEGVGFCEGWSIVLDANHVSWVENQYLAGSSPSVSRPPTPRPTAQPTTVAPPPATVTPTPVGPSQAVIDYLMQVRADLLGFSSQMTTIIANHNDGAITAEVASSQSYALEASARSYSDEVLAASNSLAGVSASCESARQWLGDALFYRGLSAGYSGLGYEFWPNVSFADADAATERSFDSLETADGYLNACIAGQ